MTTTVLIDGWEWLVGPSRIHYMPITNHGLVVVEADDNSPRRWLTLCSRGPHANSKLTHTSDADGAVPVCVLCWRRFTSATVDMAHGD